MNMHMSQRKFLLIKITRQLFINSDLESAKKVLVRYRLKIVYITFIFDYILAMKVSEVNF